MLDLTISEIMKMKEKVFIAIPCSEGSRYSEFWQSLQGVYTPPNTITQQCRGIYIANNQNTLARMFLESNQDWFWLVNDDQIYPPDILIRLLRHRKDVVAPNCLEKKPPHLPLLYQSQNGKGIYKNKYLIDGQTGLVKIVGAGGGGMLVHRRVLEAIKDPWWEVHTVLNDNGVSSQSSEDFDFCQKVIDAGFEIYGDLSLWVGHIIQMNMQPIYSDGQWYTMFLRFPDEQISIPAGKEPTG
jgi:hypothetical protein